MNRTELKNYLSIKAKERGINKLCCLECKKVMQITSYSQHIEKHEGINRIYVNNGKKEIKIRESIDDIPKGYLRGRLKTNKV